jgi:hypothetical protein
VSFPSSNDSNSDTSEGTISSITLTPEEVYHVLVALDREVKIPRFRCTGTSSVILVSNIFVEVCTFTRN